MSSLIIGKTDILEVLPHPNADRLEIVKVKGWYCIVGKDVYKVGDEVIYIPIDSMIPKDLAEQLNIWSYLHNKTEDAGRIKTVKLRGSYSQGLIIPTDILTTYGKDVEGRLISEVLGIVKYEPKPAKYQGLNGGISQRDPNPNFFRYTDIENIKNYPDVLTDGEDIIITEKIHGTNFRVANIDGKLHVGTRRCDLEVDGIESFYDKNPYAHIFKKYDLENILQPGEQIFGEIYGCGIQKLTYDLRIREVRFFDIIRDTVYVNYEEFCSFCRMNNLPIVPELHKGKWNVGLMKLAGGNSAIANHIREGVVIRPAVERYDHRVGRVILKHINEKYLTKDYGDIQ